MDESGGDVTAAEFQHLPEYDPDGDIIKHLTTYVTCSCQFPSRYGVFCPHQAHLYVANGFTEVPLEVITAVWVGRPSAALSSAREHFLQSHLSDG